MNELIEVKERNGRFVVSSKEIAEKFNKKHDDVLKSVRYLIRKLPNDFEGGKFELIENAKTNSFGKAYKESEYFMDRDGFSLLTMGFTGKKALAWKIKFLGAFNKMEDVIKKEIPRLLERIAALELNQRKTNNLLSPQRGTLMTPIWEENIFGEMQVTRFERRILEQVDKLDALEAKQLHAQKTLNGITKAIEKISASLNIENRTRQAKVIKLLKPK